MILTFSSLNIVNNLYREEKLINQNLKKIGYEIKMKSIWEK